MNTFLKNGWIQKLIILVVIVLLFNFIYPNYAYAGIGGTLLDPIRQLTLFIGDVFLGAVQYAMVGEFTVAISFNEGFWEKAGNVLKWIGVGVALAASIIAIPFTGGASAGVTALVVARYYCGRSGTGFCRFRST